MQKKMMEVAILSEAPEQRTRWQKIALDTALALASILALTLALTLFQTGFRLPDSVLVYLLAILALASTRGSYAALLAAILAFFSFDFFFVPPLYSLIIAKLADFMALIVFLVTAITTGQLTSALRKYAEQARRREREARVLYRLVQETERAGDVRQQLRVFVQELLEVFTGWQIYDGLLLLPDAEGLFTFQIRATPVLEQLSLSHVEQELVDRVVREQHPINNPVHLFGLRVPQPLSTSTPEHQPTREIDALVHLLPLQTSQEVLAVLCLLVAPESPLLSIDQDLSQETSQLTPQAVFLRIFLEQAIALIERGRLRQESLRIKVLQETDTLRAALLSSVSHDLRTPLSAIMTAATSLGHEDARWDAQERRKQARLIEVEARRLNRLVENLLDMSRIEAGALCPDRVLYPLDELIRDVLGRLERMLQGRPLRLVVPPDLPPIELDYMQIDQVVTNLLENAARYTPATSAIDIELIDRQELIEVRIADRGPGVPVDEREQIFGKFYRASGNVARGSGLGLTVCKGLVEAHGGRIWAEAREGGGALFCFTLAHHATEKKSSE